MRNLLKKLPSPPRRLSCFGEGESEINRPTEDSNTPAYPYDEAEWARQQAEFNKIFETSQTTTSQPVEQATMYAYGAGAQSQPATTSSGFWNEVKQAANAPFEVKVTSGEEMEYGIMTPAPTPSPTIAAVAPNSKQVAVQPSTQTQIFNLVDTVAKGLLAVQQTQAQSKLSVAQQQAAAEQSKVQAQNYVQSQLSAGKSVMVPKDWLTAYSQSGTWTKWLTPILIVGGVGLLAFAVYKYTQKPKTVVAANPRRHAKRRR